MRVFLDANILFSASNPKWLTHQFVELLLLRVACLTNAYAVEEARRNLTRHAPSHLPHLETLLARVESVPTMISELEVKMNAKDQPILEGAVAGRATHLLTGDRKDFRALFGQQVHSVKIVDQAALAKELAALGML